MSDTENQILEALTQLNARLDRLEARMDLGTVVSTEKSAALSRAADTLVALERSLPKVLDAAATVAGDMYVDLLNEGVDPTELALGGAEVLKKLAQPHHLEVLNKVLAHPKLGTLATSDANLAAVEKLLGQEELLQKVSSDEQLELVHFLLDNGPLLKWSLTMGAAVKAAFDKESIDVDAFSERSAFAAVTLAKVMQTPEFEGLLNSGALGADTIGVVSKASTALVETQAGPVERLGFFGMLMRMGDPDVQAALSFGLGIAQRFGATLK